jgi:hypothetical protein
MTTTTLQMTKILAPNPFMETNYQRGSLVKASSPQQSLGRKPL